MAIDLSGLTSQLDTLNTNVTTLSQGDMTDPENLIEMQQALAKYQEVYGALSAIISDMKTTAMSIIQKM
jgi:hypothetical protein